MLINKVRNLDNVGILLQVELKILMNGCIREKMYTFTDKRVQRMKQLKTTFHIGL